MRIKLDENLGRQCRDLLVAGGHDVATIADQSMCSAEDGEVIEACRSEGRALVTLDSDFSNPLVYRPQDCPGIAVLRLPTRPSHTVLITLVKTFIDALKREELAGKLWSVEAGRIRIYQPPGEP